MKFKTTLILGIGISIFSGCTSMKVTSEQAREYPFSTIKTYQWIDGPAEILDPEDTYTNDDLQQALNRELMADGWIERDDADVQVAYYIKLKENQEYASTDMREREFSGGFTFKQDGKTWSYDERKPDLNVYTVEIGTLTVLMFDTQTGKRIWRGTLKTKINRSRPLEKQQERFKKVAEKIMAQVP